ncbi:MAG: 50S ribosomal protein L30 [archaeon]|nr:50S ribosomal protein L30 [archaeon]
MTYAVVRVRGQPDVNYNIEYTMSLLGLTRVNHCTIVPENDVVRGMLQKSKDYITWGEINEKTLADMIRIRGKVAGDKTITDAYLLENSNFKTIDDVANAIICNKGRMKDIKGAKSVFRLHPPIKGFEGNKRSFQNGGSLGYRGSKINELIARML